MLNRILKSWIFYIITLSLIMQMLSLNWGLVTDNPGLFGLAAFHMDEPGIAQLPLQMILNHDLNPHWFIEPSGYLYAIFIPLYILKLFTPIFTVLDAMVIGRLISIMFTLLTVFVVYLIGKVVYDERVGLIAALLLAINPYYYYFSIFVKQDSMTVFLVTLSIYCFIRYIQNEKLIFYLITMFVCGLATSTKYVAGLTLITFPIFFIAMNIKSLNFIDLFKKVLLSILIFIFGFVFLTPYSIISPREFLSGSVGEFVHYSTGHEGVGYQNYYTHIKTLLGFWDNTNVVGIGFSAIFILIGLIFLFSNFKRMDKKIMLPNALSLYFIALIFLIFSLVIKVKMANQMMMAIPMLMTIGAYGIQKYIHSNSYRTFKILIVIVFIILTVTYTFSVIISRDGDNRYNAAQWFIENVKADEPIAVTPYVYVPSQFTNVTIINPNNYNLNWLQESNYSYIILSSNLYSRYFNFKEEFPEKYAFFDQIINKKTKYRIIKKFNLTETISKRTFNFGISSLLTKDYQGEVEIYILKII